MQTLTNVFAVVGLLAGIAVPAVASVTVSSPVSGTEVISPFALSASASTCSSEPTAALGYSLDSSTDTTIVAAISMNASVPAPIGAHTLHVKAWGNKGAACVTDIAITVVSIEPGPKGSTVVSDGITVSSPSSGSTVTTSIPIVAGAAFCTSQTVTSMGYSIDSGATLIYSGETLVETPTAAVGAHTLHIKSWGVGGVGCDVDVPVTVASSTSSTGSGISVSTPAVGANVSTSFPIVAGASSCSSQTVTAMGYSLDSGATTIVDNTAVSSTVTTTAGAHTLHVKSWGNAGAGCDSDVAIVAVASSAPAAPSSGITVTSPANGATVATSFNAQAAASTCSSQAVTAMGYSLDSGATTIVQSNAVSSTITTTTGAHTLHVKSWGNAGAGCDSDVAITASGSSESATSVIPSNAVSVSSIQALSNWVAVNDTATSGSANGTMSVVSSPTIAGYARKFDTSYSKSGGERYYVSFGDDTTALNFFYDAWIYVSGSSADVANIEMDMNQTMANGQTALFGFQCDGYYGVWDYTENSGTPTKPVDTWVKSSAPCNPRNWGVNAWHHVQVYYSRTTTGSITYHSVWLDSNEQDINATVNSAFALGWGPSLLTNFQVDGLGTSGSSTLYLDEVTITRW